MDLSTITIILGLFAISMLIFGWLTRDKQPKTTINIEAAYPELAGLVRQSLAEGKDEVKVIKMVREQTGAGLVEAKVYVDKVKQTQ